jgi:N-acetylglucosaminyldiphosphoundecaprenol N-acetyl-beta-D-mannosaminyltransferase
MTQEIFGYNVYTDSRLNLENELASVIENGGSVDMACLNTLKLYLGSKNKDMQNLLKEFKYILPDGQSVVFSLRFLKGIRTKAISGAELMMDLINIADKRHYSVYFLGSPQDLLDKVKEKISSGYPGIKKAGYQHGYYSVKDEQEIVKSINKFAPDFLFVAFGSPRKEEFIRKYADSLNARVIMGVGGSFEVFVGEKNIGSVSKKLGLRWLFRTFQDPLRLFPRYLKCNNYFIYLFLKEILSSGKKSSKKLRLT